jgi:hypothetical protein
LNSKYLVKSKAYQDSLENPSGGDFTTKNTRKGSVNESRERGINLEKLKEKKWRRKLASNRKSLESTWL